ncbi:MAG: hypothetical protein M3Q55_07700 [Acidobacteriota bacterium]|nr:hypothetical protein [Acidobacteriota bacterium]
MALSTGCFHENGPEQLAGTVTWSMTRQYQDPAAPSRHELLTTSVTMDVVLTVTQARGGVRLYQGLGGVWAANGNGTFQEKAGDCTLARDTAIGVQGSFGPAGNNVTLLHNQPAQRALLNFSVSRGEGAVTATTRYCDGSTVAKDTKYFWGIADAGVDVRVETGPRGATRYIVSKEETGPCGDGATCTRTASGVLVASPGD